MSCQQVRECGRSLALMPHVLMEMDETDHLLMSDLLLSGKSWMVMGLDHMLDQISARKVPRPHLFVNSIWGSTCLFLANQTTGVRVRRQNRAGLRLRDLCLTPPWSGDENSLPSCARTTMNHELDWHRWGHEAWQDAEQTLEPSSHLKPQPKNTPISTRDNTRIQAHS